MAVSLWEKEDFHRSDAQIARFFSGIHSFFAFWLSWPPLFRVLTGKNNPVRLVQLRDVFTCPYNLRRIVSF
jgi:hypothetical protein